VLRFMQTPAECTGPLNVGNPKEFTILELAERVVKLTGSKSKVVHKPLPADDPTQRQPDIAAARKLIDWEPLTPLEAGLEKTIEYFRTQGVGAR